MFCFHLIDIDLYIHHGDSDKGTLPLTHLLLFLMNLLVSWSRSFGMISLITLNLRNLHSYDSLWSSIQYIWITYRFLCIPNSHEGSNSEPDHAYADGCFPVHEIRKALLFAWVFSIDLKWHNEVTFMFSLNLSFYPSSYIWRNFKCQYLTKRRLAAGVYAFEDVIHWRLWCQ